MATPAVQIKNLAEFRRELKAFTTAIPEQVLLLQKKVALDLLTRIVQRNPVGNPDLWQNPDGAPPGYVGGRSRANWQVAVGPAAPDAEVNSKADEGTIIAEGIAAMNAARPFETIWVYNNVPYIVRLEFGWSSQAPEGMVRLSVAEVESAFATPEK